MNEKRAINYNIKNVPNSAIRKYTTMINIMLTKTLMNLK